MGRRSTRNSGPFCPCHDPDGPYRYRTTGADYKERESGKFGNLVSERAKESASQNELPEDCCDWVEKTILNAELDPWTVSEELQQEILIRLAPFHLNKQHSTGLSKQEFQVRTISEGAKPRYLLTALVDVLKSSDKPTQVTQIAANESTDAAISTPKLERRKKTAVIFAGQNVQNFVPCSAAAGSSAAPRRMTTRNT